MKQIKDQRGEQRASTRKEKEEQAFSLLVPAATKLGLENPSWVLIICFSGALLYFYLGALLLAQPSTQTRLLYFLPLKPMKSDHL